MASKKRHNRRNPSKTGEHQRRDASKNRPASATPLNALDLLYLARSGRETSPAGEPAPAAPSPIPSPADLTSPLAREDAPRQAEAAPAPPPPAAAPVPSPEKPEAVPPPLVGGLEPWRREEMGMPLPGDSADERGEEALAPQDESTPEETLPVTCEDSPLPAEVFAGTGDQDEDEDDMNERQPTQPVPADKRLYIVMITPEVAPCSKVGGLGDVIHGLGRELMRRGHGVEIITPMYSCLRHEAIEDLHEEYSELWCPHYNNWNVEKVYQGKVDGLQVNFITGGNYTLRDKIYGYDDDGFRFTYFCRQALEFMFKTNRRPDIIHCHDWTTGLVPVMLYDIYQKLGWNKTRAVYTIHNNECQGLYGYGDKLLGMVGLDIKNYMRPDRLQDDLHRNCINMMKGGIVYSNFTTTVSPTYAGELKSPLGGRGLQATIARHSAKIGGVLNGIDYDAWNPATDRVLRATYSPGKDFYNKYENKAALREWLELNDSWKPIVSVVTRLTQQKGLDLIKRAIFSALEEKAQFVLLGSAPDPRVNNDFIALRDSLADNHDVNLYIGYHEDLSHMIYAGSDILVIPSLYEPCGLTQMIALRYGTVPVVRETGGLVDTVYDLDNSGRGLSNANGYTFREPTPAGIDSALKRAIRLWFDNPEAFNRLTRNGMRCDYSWRNPTKDYENIYNYIKA